MRSVLKLNIIAAFLLPAACGFLTGCGNGDPRHPDVSDIDVDVKIRRFDRDFFAIDTTNLEAGMQKLAQQYPEMFPLFAVNIIHDQTNPNETPAQAVGGFLRSQQVRRVYDTVQQVYGDLRWLEKDLTQMFRYYKYYFPQKPVPQVVAMVSEFATDAFTAGDSLCGIGLDMFLGENYPSILS